MQGPSHYNMYVFYGLVTKSLLYSILVEVAEKSPLYPQFCVKQQELSCKGKNYYNTNEIKIAK